MASYSALPSAEGGDSAATTSAASLKPSPIMPRHDIVSEQETSRPADTIMMNPSIATFDTEGTNSNDPFAPLNAGGDAKPGDKSMESDGPANNEDEAAIDSESSSNSHASIYSPDSNPRLLQDASSRVTRARRRSIFNKKFIQHRDHLQLTEDRILLMEKRLDKLENKPPPPRAIRPSNKRVAAVPELNFVDWATFKATRNVRYVDSEPRHAIDVLLGEPLPFLQRHKTSNDIEEISNLPSRETEHMPLKAVPERVRINSFPLNETLKSTLRLSNRIYSRPLVILRPYKALLHHEDEFRDTLAAMAQILSVRSGGATRELYVPSRDQSTKLPSLTLGIMQEALDELRCLLRFIESLKPLIEKIRTCPCPETLTRANSAVVQYKDLWYIFQPGQYLFSRLGIQKVWRVIQVTGGRRLLSVEGSPSTIDALRVKPSSPFEMDCYYLDFDGIRFGPVHRRFQIRPFEGSRQITSLDVYPIEYQSDHGDIVDHLTKRGAEFVGLTQVSHKYFKGRTIVWAPDGTRITGPMHERKAHGISYPEHVESPVIVDFNRTIQFNPEWGPKLNIGELAEQDVCETLEMSSTFDRRHLQHMPPLPGSPGSREPPRLDTMCKEPGCCENEEILLDFQWDRRRMEDFVSKEDILSPYGVDKDYVVSEEQLRLLPNRVFGFILRSRKWGESIILLNDIGLLLTLKEKR